MNFSELFKQSSQLCRFSPDGRYLGNIVQYRAIVRDVKTLQILQLYTCLDAVQHIEWSPDSQFVLCGMFKRGLIQVFSLEEPEWTCKIDEGSAGLLSVRWSPDSRHILATAEFNLRITVWSLTTKSVSYIKYPKACQHALDFSSDGEYLALAESRDCRDYISIFEVSGWQLATHFETDTENLTGLQWSPDCRVLAVWDSCLQYKILLYSLDGHCISTFTAYQFALGIKSVTWAPTSQFLAIGSYDEKVRLINHLTWKLIVEHGHPAKVNNTDVIVYREVIKTPQLTQGDISPPHGMALRVTSKYEVEEELALVPVVKPDPDKANPKLGVGSLAFSHDASYMYTINDNMPTALWIWNMKTLKQACLLLQDAPIKYVDWDPTEARLVLCTGTNKVYMWSPAGCLSVEVPSEASFQVSAVQWHPEGNAFLLMGRDDMCVCFLSDREQDL